MSFQQQFMESKGQPIYYNGIELKMIDRFKLYSSITKLNVTFLSTKSAWKQGIVLQTKGLFEINDSKFPNKIVLWEHTAPKMIEMIIKSKDRLLIVYNAWMIEDGTIHSWHNGGAMCVEENENYRVYNCNDGYPDDDFDDLVFRIEILNNV